MHPSLKPLIELQRIDSRLNEVQARLAAFPKKFAEVQARLEAAQAVLQRAKDDLTKSLKERKTYELDVEQWKEKLRKYKDQSFQVKSNEAYRALQHEIQMAEAEIARAEDRLLERMVAGEEFERQVKAAEKSLAEIQKTCEAERQALAAEQAAVEKELSELNAERARAAAAVPEELLDHYLRIARKHGGIGLAEVGADETCPMCRVRVRPHTYQILRDPNSQEIVHCESCTRILYCAEATAPPAQPASASLADTAAGADA
jgi:predicted  nucleic acid-binding Zn-ribbon protein